MRTLVSIWIVMSTVTAFANITCPSNAELFKSTQVEENAGFITFREIQKNDGLNCALSLLCL